MPPRLLNLFTGSRSIPEVKHFQDNTRFYNAGMAMASLQVNDSTVYRRGPAAFKVYGQMHRRVGSITANPNATQYSCIQTYFCDPNFQDRHRASRNGTQSSSIQALQEWVFRILREVLTQDAGNTYLQSFLNINEYVTRSGINPEEVHLEQDDLTCQQHLKFHCCYQ